MGDPLAAPIGPRYVGPKRHHYLPEVYLKGFEHEGGVAVFDRQTGDVRRQSVNGTCVVGHLYTFIDEQGRKRYDLEELLSRIETGFGDALPRLEANEGVTFTDIEYLLTFIAFAELRTPDAIQAAKDARAEFARTIGNAATSTPERAYMSLRQMYRDKRESVPEETILKQARDVADFVQRGRFTIEVDDQAALMGSIKLWPKLAAQLYRMDLRIIEATGDARYITCDAPVVLTSTNGERAGFGSPNALVLFPLSARRLLMLSGNKCRVEGGQASAQKVAAANRVIAANTRRYAIGPSERELADLCGSLGLAATQRQPRYDTGQIVLPDGSNVGYLRRNAQRIPGGGNGGGSEGGAPQN